MPKIDSNRRLHALEEYLRTKSYCKRNVLVELYRPTVEIIARKVSIRDSARFDVEDLTQWGIIGLIGAIERFSSGKLPQFDVYIRICVHGSIIDAIRRLEFQRKRGVDISIDERGNEVKQYHRAGPNAFDRRQGRTSTVISICDLDHLDQIADRRFGNPDEITEDGEVWTIVQERLSKNERLAITLHFRHHKTLREIAHRLCVSEPRVSQLVRSGLAFLRGFFTSSKARRSQVDGRRYDHSKVRVPVPPDDVMDEDVVPA